MADVSVSNFRDKTISELVEELNNLGDSHVTMQPTTLVGIQDCESDSIRRFRSRSMHKSRNSNAKSPQKVVQSEFFLADGSQKKYYYNEIVNELESEMMTNILSKFDQQFNTTIIMQYSHQHFQEFLIKLTPWFED